jgi:hypothetical protein
MAAIPLLMMVNMFLYLGIVCVGLVTIFYIRRRLLIVENKIQNLTQIIDMLSTANIMTRGGTNGGSEDIGDTIILGDDNLQTEILDNTILIDVSDDECNDNDYDGDGDDDNDDSDDDNDDDDADDDDSDDDDGDDDDDDDDNTVENKIIVMDETEISVEETIVDKSLDVVENTIEHVEENSEENNTHMDNEDNEDNEDEETMQHVKHIELAKDSLDYNKMNLKQLRETMMNRGYEEAAKMNKKDILKLLGVN